MGAALRPTSAASDLLWPNVSSSVFVNECRRWGSLSFLSGIGLFCDSAPWLISLIMIGHVSTQDLAALGIIEVWLYSFLEVIWSGLGLTESVLVSQAHGKKNLLAMRGWAFFTVIAMTAGNCFITVLCLTAAPTLKGFGLDPILVDIGQTYAYWMIPACFVEGLNICIATYLCSLQAPRIPTLIALLGVFIDIPVTYFFIFGKGGDGRFFSNALIASAMGWLVSAAVVFLLNVAALAHLWGKELEYGDKEEEEEEEEGGGAVMVLNGDSASKKKQQMEAVTRGGETVTRVRNKSLGGGGGGGGGARGGGARGGVGFRRNSGINAAVSSTLSTSTSESSTTETAASSPRDRSATGESGQGLYARLLSAGEKLGNDDDDVEDDDDGEREAADAKSILRWSGSKRRWRIYSKQAAPNCLTILLQCSVFTVLSFLAANLGAVEIAAHNQNIALLEVAFTFVGGMAEATSIRVGFHVGRGNIEAAKLVAQIAFAVNAALGIVVGLVGYYFRRELASSLSSDPAVVAVSVELAPLLWGTFALFSVGDQALGVLEGQGRASAQAVSFLVGCVAVTIPLALLSYSVTDFGLLGLWYALFIGFLLSEILAFVLVLWYSNWAKAVSDAVGRTEAEADDDSAEDQQWEQDQELLHKITQIRKTGASRDEAEE